MSNAHCSTKIRFIDRSIALSFAVGATVLACAERNEAPTSRPLPTPASEAAEIELLERTAVDSAVAVAEQRWSEATHVNIAALVASRWQLPSNRVDVISDAADAPDTYEAGIDNGFNQQWSHAYLYSALGFWIWGDANENFDDCLTGRLAGQLEGPECKDGLSASYFYARGDQVTGDAYLGYALHYIEDVNLVLHASDPTLAPDMLTNHFKFENWVKNNWDTGHNFSAAVAADNSYYPISDLQQSVRNAAWAVSYWNSSGPGRKAWNAYRSCGYPTGVGTGNADVVAATKQMLIRAGRYAAGAIKYTLDTYAQWTAKY